ncbi:MAG: peptide-methionine (R)-S-oxide reductase MsrB [Cytophagales bacterium]|nr:peptide-methionine (R)-S-oxide reductase MsrB [Cytophagales bacterium]
MPYKVQKTSAEWQAELAEKNAEPVAFEVTRNKATERPYTGKYEQHWERGSYACICCGHKLFESETKFDAGCGWPSFSKTASDNAIEEKRDMSHGMVRVETVCANCGAHLGHVFDDGPRNEQHTTGLRYCMNSASLAFDPLKS